MSAARKFPAAMATRGAVAPRPAAAAVAYPPRPQRPLSAYNLFYRYKRVRILAAAKGGDDSKEAVTRTIEAPSGLEDVAQDELAALATDEIEALRRQKILTALADNLQPKDTSKRCHKKSANGGGLSFLELGRAMVSAWKDVDPFALSVYETLAKEGREKYKAKAAEYDRMYPQAPKKRHGGKGSKRKARGQMAAAGPRYVRPRAGTMPGRALAAAPTKTAATAALPAKKAVVPKKKAAAAAKPKAAPKRGLPAAPPQQTSIGGPATTSVRPTQFSSGTVSPDAPLSSLDADILDFDVPLFDFPLAGIPTTSLAESAGFGGAMLRLASDDGSSNASDWSDVGLLPPLPGTEQGAGELMDLIASL